MSALRDTHDSFCESKLSLEELTKQSDQLLKGVQRSKPYELWQEHGFQAFDKAIKTVTEEKDINFDPSTLEFAKLAFANVRDLIQMVLAKSHYVGSLDERVGIATDDKTIGVIGLLAARDNDLMNEMLGRLYKTDEIVLDPAAGALKMSRDAAIGAAATINDRRCPFAGLYKNGKTEQKPAAVFISFARWAAELAVYYDDPSYNKRNPTT